jgi:threonine/homoserine/homoserine lactone efflux protein
MGKAAAIVCYIGGAIILFFGVVFMAFAFTLPIIVGGSVLIFGLLMMVIGGVIIYLGYRSSNKQVRTSAGPP